jgi:hypothetical protein
MTDFAGEVRGVAPAVAEVPCRCSAIVPSGAHRQLRPRDTPPILGVAGESIGCEMRGGIDRDGRAGSTPRRGEG